MGCIIPPSQLTFPSNSFILPLHFLDLLKGQFHLDVNFVGTLDSVSTLMQYWVKVTLNAYATKEVTNSLVTRVPRVSFTQYCSKDEQNGIQGTPDIYVEEE